MKILGICSDTFISSAALIENGKIIAAIPEERLNRQKNYRGFPKKAIHFCLNEVDCKIEDIDYIAIAWNPGHHIKEYNQKFSDSIRWGGENLYAIPNNLMQFFDNKQVELIEQNLLIKNSKCKIIFVNHHISHAANAFFLSPFEEAAILSVDGRGEEETALYASGKSNKITKIKSIKLPHSLGFFYGTFTEFLGFRPNFDEWKVMALASYTDENNPYYKKVKKLVNVLTNGMVELDLSYFTYYIKDQLTWYSDKFVEEFGKPRYKDDEITKRHYQIAAALQKVTEEILVECLNHLHDITGLKKVVIGGGLFMNSVFNGKISSLTKFEELFVSSCPDDSGTSIGAALYIYNEKTKNSQRVTQKDNYYGPSFTNEEIQLTLEKFRLPSEYIANIEEFAAKKISEGKLIGWFQDRMEFGQRALGNRSILCDPRDPKMKDKVNLVVKYRENFRPFAPSILKEYTKDFFEIKERVFVPFMEKVYPIKKEKRHLIPAVTHVDGTGRLQTVNKETNKKYYKLISQFKKITGIPIVFNTSFNLNGEPIVCTPTDAIRTFFSCGLDLLILGNYVVKK